LITLFIGLAIAGPADDLASIRAAWTAVEAQISANETAVTSLDFNATKRSWPAVGRYEQTFRVHQITDPERSPYPSVIVKIETQRVNSTRTESHAYLYGPDGAVRFVHATNPEHPDVRAYYTKGSILRVQVGDTVLAEGTGPAGRLLEEARAALALAKTLAAPSTSALEDQP
jgi:hypothetical protein